MNGCTIFDMLSLSRDIPFTCVVSVSTVISLFLQLQNHLNERIFFNGCFCLSQAGVDNNILMRVAVFQVYPLELVGMLEINKKVISA